MREERPFEHGDTIHPIYIEICVWSKSVHEEKELLYTGRRREGTRRDLSKTGEDRSSTRPSKDRLLSSKSEQTRGYCNLFSLSHYIYLSIFLFSSMWCSLLKLYTQRQRFSGETHVAPITVQRLLQHDRTYCLNLNAHSCPADGCWTCPVEKDDWKEEKKTVRKNSNKDNNSNKKESKKRNRTQDERESEWVVE